MGSRWRRLFEQPTSTKEHFCEPITPPHDRRHATEELLRFHGEELCPLCSRFCPLLQHQTRRSRAGRYPQLPAVSDRTAATVCTKYQQLCVGCSVCLHRHS